MGVVPIVNENDTVSVSVRVFTCTSIRYDGVSCVGFAHDPPQEIKFGDNDTLSAITSSMIHADYLILLTDVDGLYTSNPRKDPNAARLDVVSSIASIRSQGVLVLSKQ